MTPLDPVAKKPEDPDMAVDSVSKKGRPGTGGVDARFTAALDRAAKASGDMSAWDELEAVAGDLQRPEEVSDLYLKVLRKADPEAAGHLGPRALRFHEEWFGDDQGPLTDLLKIVLAHDPSLDWAFDRLTLVLSVGQRWHDLLAFYDDSLARLKDGPKRRKLLAEAAGVAKDSLHELDRAIAYLDELFNAKPSDQHVAASLERLLEKQERWADLARVWTVRLDFVSGPEAQDVRERLARLRLGKLADPQGALDEAKALLAAGHDQVALQVLETILKMSDAPADARREALRLLRSDLDKQGGARDRLVAALETAEEFASADEKAKLLREAAERLQSSGETSAAMDKLVELCALSPDDAEVRTRLRHLAELSGAHDVYVKGLADAAAATKNGLLRASLLIEAGRVEEDLRLDRPAAIAFFARASEEPGTDDTRKLAALRRLASLLDGETEPKALLDALERLAALTPERSERHALLGRAGRVAVAAAETNRAIAAWQSRLDADATDREALDALIEILAESRRWQPLAALLRRRAELGRTEEANRADLARVAVLNAAALGDNATAIATWVEVQQRFGEDPASIAALRGLLEQEKRWEELATLLGRAGESERTRLTEMFARLGDVCREELARPTDAVKAYAFALETNPAFAPARAGLAALLDHPGCGTEALQVLVRGLQSAREVAPLAELTDRRLALLPDDAARSRMLIELGDMLERQSADLKGALAQLCRALVLNPDNARTEAQVLRLASLCEGWPQALDAIRGAIERLDDESPRKVHLRLQEGALLESNFQELPGALGAFEAALALAPDRLAARVGVVRVASGLDRFADAARAMLHTPLSSELVRTKLMPLLILALKANDRPERWTAAARAVSEAVGRRDGIPPFLARELEETVAGWFAEHGKPGEDIEVEAALLRAARYDVHHVPVLERLCDVQRARPGRPLFDTLMRLAEVRPADLDPWLEALELAAGPLADRPLAIKTGYAVFERATHILRSGGQATGSTAAPAALVRSVDSLTRLLTASGDKTEAARAVSVLLDSTTLSLPVDTIRAMRRQAARIAIESVGDRARGREIFRAIVTDEPEDRAAIATLAALYEEAELLSELLGLRRRELGTVKTTEDRIALRLEMGRIAGLIEERSPRIPTLLANLEDAPGDPRTVAALSELMEGRGKHADLVEVLQTQAKTLDQAGQSQRAAALFQKVAEVCETALGDPARAVTAYERVAALAPTAEGLDALARLLAARGDHMAAAGWLEQRLGDASGPERVDIALALGRAYLACGQRHRAIGCLERAIAEAPGARDIRAVLIETYRAAGSWEALAKTLADGCALPAFAPRAKSRGKVKAEAKPEPRPEVEAERSEEILAFAREAAEIYRNKLGRPELAVPVLERAAERLPQDRWVRTALAEGLRVAGRLSEARKLLQGLLEEMGRRRSKERAAIHHQIALCARAEGDLGSAIDNLEQASAMDVASMEILVDLGETAETAREFERAERAYQALLLLARRAEPGDALLSVSESLLRLETVARARGDEAAATERRESALAAAMQSPVEAARLQKAFIARGQADAALDLLERRRAAAGSALDEAAVERERAETLAGLARHEEALAAIGTAMERAPDVAEVHDTARRLADGASQPEKYLTMVEAALEQMRRRDDGPRVCDLLMRAGQAAELDLQDFKRAAIFYGRAEQTGARALDVMAAVARTSHHLQDRGEETRALKQIARMASEAESPVEQAEISFRLAELQLRSAETRTVGLETLATALDKKPDFARALEIVRAAEVPEDELPRVMSLYERVARASGDDRMLLDFLERRAAAKDVTQEEVSEGVELALTLGELTRAEKLLERAVSLARAAGTMREASWALVDLAQRRKSAGDLEGAFTWLEEASRASDSPRIPALLREVARDASARPGTAAIAARAFESLRARNPAERELWEPLVDLYIQLGDEARLAPLVSETVEKMVDRHDRIFLRMKWARFLMERGRDEDATSVLRDVLLEDPGHHEGITSLAELLERRGEVAEAVTLVSEALREAESRGEVDWLAAASRKLGDLLKKADPAQARQVYRQALGSPIPDRELKRSLQQSLYDLLGDDDLAEKARLGEDLVTGDEGPGAARKALEIANLHRQVGRESDERRLLEMGRARAPESLEIFDRLAELLESRQDWSAWAVLMDAEATRRADSDPAAAASLLREAAQTRREKLSDPAGAAELLKKAASLGPTDVEQVRELAACLEAMGDAPGAAEVVGGALQRGDLATPDRLFLLRLRADIRIKERAIAAAVDDLEQAFALAGPEVAGLLTDALFALSSQAADSGDADGERRAMLRLAEIFTLQGETDRAQDLLFTWVDNHPEDKAALQALRGRFEAAERWEEVLQVCQRLVVIEEGEARVEAALGLAHAAEQVGRPVDAMRPLEALLEKFPGQPAVMNVLTELYRSAGETRKLALLKIKAAEQLETEDERFAALTEGADILLQEGDLDGARVAINKACELRPDDRIVKRLLGDTLLTAGRFAEASAVLNDLIGDGRGVERGELCSLYHRVARAAGALGRTDDQLSALRKALEADRHNGAVASELADLAESVGDDDTALKALRTITMHCPDGPMPIAVSFLRQARIAAKNGDRQRALIFAKRALQENPELSEANQLLDQIR
jgi:tetratricopeptide (TPR) repeat protein